MNKTWQLRALTAYLALGVPLAASCAKEANTLEDEATDTGGSSSSGKGNSKAGGTAKAGNSGAFGGTSSSGGKGSGGKATGSAGEEAADGGDTGTSAGTAGSGGGGGGAGGSTGVPPDVLARASVVLQYMTEKTSPTPDKIFMKMYLENKSDDPLSVANVKVRYWFTAEATPQVASFFHGANIAGQAQSFVLDADNSHVLITFTGNSIKKTDDINLNEFQLQIDGGAFNQSNDFSWNAAYTSRMPNGKITVYLADKLVWGCEPAGKCFDDDIGAGGAPP